MAGEFRVFISAVTSEFGKARTAIAADLRAKGLIVKVQDEFRAEAGNDSGTLLGLLREYIHSCDAVVCVIGKRSGACPTAAEVEQFAHLKILPPGIADASYTQWELFFARFYKRRLSAYVATDAYKPDQDKPSGLDLPDLQAAYVQHLKDEGLQRNPFATPEALRIAVLREKWEFPARTQSAAATSTKPVALPYPSLGPLFKGRDAFLKRLRDSLTRAGGGKAAVYNALHGMGGIGKTRAAVEYAWAHQDDYAALLFVIGETPESLRRNLAALSATLVPGIETTDEAAHVNAVLDWLKANPGWLLILDNLDSKEALAEAEKLMAPRSGGHVIITSRLTNFAAEIEPLELDVLGKDDAAAFLLERTKNRRRTAADDAQQAHEIAHELGYLALALEQAGAYIAARRLTFADYLKEWRASGDKVMAWSDPLVTHYPRAVAQTWQTSVEQLAPAGRRLLERLAWLAPEPIPEFLLDVPAPGAEGENLHDAYADLAAYSLVTRDAQGPFFTVHRLVQDVTRRSLGGDAGAERLNGALRWINEAFSGDPGDVRNWPRLEPLMPHARAIARHGDAAGLAELTARLMNQIGLLLKTKALHAEAEPLYRRALAIHEKSFGPDHSDAAICLSNLAALLFESNRLAEAEPLMRRTLAVFETNFGPNHPTVATSLNNLAQLMKSTNRSSEAEPLMRRALEIDENNLGPDHPNVAVRLSNLASLLQDTSRLTEAEPLYQRALAIEDKSFGADHPNFALCLNNLADLLHDTNRLAEAEPLYRRALAILVRSLGLKHPLSTKVGNNYAVLLHDMGKSDAEIKAAIEAVLAESVDSPPPTPPRHA